MLVYTGMAADILEIFEAFRENKVISGDDDDDGGLDIVPINVFQIPNFCPPPPSTGDTDINGWLII